MSACEELPDDECRECRGPRGCGTCEDCQAFADLHQEEADLAPIHTCETWGEFLIRRGDEVMVARHGAEKWAEMNAWAGEQLRNFDWNPATFTLTPKVAADPEPIEGRDDEQCA